MMTTRRMTALVLSAALTLAIAPAALAGTPPSDIPPAVDTAHAPRPTTYTVTSTPDENLEGIEVTREETIYVTSVATGAVFKGSTRHGTLQRWLPAGSDGRAQATGVHVDAFGRVLIAGASTGQLFIYSADGTLLGKRGVPGESFLNDFAFTRDAVFVTDSASGTVYRASLSAEGVGELVPFVTADAFAPKAVFLNGIAVTPDQRYLIVSDWDTNVTHRVDLRSRAVDAVQVEGDKPFGADGLLLRGHTADGVVTDWDAERAWVRTVRFSADYSRATVVHDSPTVGLDKSPTTIARDRGRLLWVDSQLNATTQVPPYTVSEVPR